MYIHKGIVKILAVKKKKCPIIIIISAENDWIIRLNVVYSSCSDNVTDLHYTTNLDYQYT